MAICYLVTLGGLSVQDNAAFDFPSLQLTNNFAVFEKHFGHPIFLNFIGSRYLTNEIVGSYFAYAIIDQEVTAEIFDVKTTLIDNLCAQHVSTLNMYFQFLWLITDHSVYIKDVFAYAPQAGKVQALKVGGYTYTCTGDAVITEYTVQQLQQNLDFTLRYASLFSGRQFSDEEERRNAESKLPPNEMFAPKLYNNNPRNVRAVYFLHDARHEQYLPTKLALYIPILECIFSTDSTEATHKVSERTAYYIGQSGAERNELYELVKEAYGFRSKYFHGDKLPTKRSTAEQQREMAVKIDRITRQVILKALTEDVERFKISSQRGATGTLPRDEIKELNAWFKDLQFGVD